MARDAESTRRRIASVALSLFREHGYAKTTMRRIAKEAGLSLGAAYHHYDGKQAIVFAYYEQQQSEHEEVARAALAEASELRERLAMVLHCGLDVRAADRALMRELAPLVVGPEDHTNAFSEATEPVRRRSIALHREALEHPAVAEDLRDAAALATWALSMGLLLYFAHDESPRQRKTRALTDGSVDLVVKVLEALSLPPFAPIRGQLRTLLEQAELLDAPTP